MNPQLKAGLIAGVVAIVAVGVIEALFAKTENDFFQFCTTKAYGWPAPWRIDWCECEGGSTTYPTTGKIVNFSSLAGSGIAAFAVVGGIPLLRGRQKSKRQNKS